MQLEVYGRGLRPPVDIIIIIHHSHHPNPYTPQRHLLVREGLAWPIFPTRAQCGYHSYYYSIKSHNL